eukprot:CAMPEP_0171574446 /NCGR_PEP_ID=MMETSP0961-20121227/5360_1 /TAXON_ID=87120 /ORGANISM="Aurantiochytrium limacinum, Strain ATCCMYA-1381" /LENGTH=742 /DNA_ID=CAMNT_0012129759 /DNA_START=70 /DNA_END=2299 /DNA_ORIENTATION=-
MPEYARALYTFVPAQEGDLGFEENDVIIIEEKDDSGGGLADREQVSGIRGEFPYNYVEMISEEEADRIMARNEAPKQFKFEADRIKLVTVVSSELSPDSGMPQFHIEATTDHGVKKSITKSVQQLRDLDVQVRGFLPKFEGVVPPRWADKAGLETIDTDKREESVENYMRRLIGEEITDYLLLVWLFPDDDVDVHSASDEISLAGEAAALAGRDENASRVSGSPVPKVSLAYVEFTWTPQDDVELFMEATQVIAILTQDTGSPGWWEGQTAGGAIGLIPYNHVELLDPRVTSAVLAGKPLTEAQAMKFDKAAGKTAAGGYADTRLAEKKKSSLRKSLSRLSLGLRRSSEKAAAQAATTPNDGSRRSHRERKIVASFHLSTIESFDRLIDNGYTMEENNKTVGQSLSGDGPQPGDFVQLSYSAYLWNEQQQCLVEFGATDMPSKLNPEGGLMEFFVGGGEVIRGVEFAVQRMSLGQCVRLVVAPQLAYGKVGLPPDVPPSTFVVFDLTLDGFGSDGKPMPQQPEFDLMPPPSFDSLDLDEDEMDDEPIMSRGRSLMMGGFKPPKPSSAKPMSRLAKPTMPKMPQPAVSKPFVREAVTNPAAQHGGISPPPGFTAPGGKPMSLHEAIAQRRAKIEQGEVTRVARPVADHMSQQLPSFTTRQPSFRPQPIQPQVNYLKPDGQFSLDELRDAVRKKKLQDLQIDQSVIEDYLPDDEFERAFKMTRGEFLLKPKWRQQALRKGVGLF